MNVKLNLLYRKANVEDGVHLSYDKMASLLAPYRNPERMSIMWRATNLSETMYVEKPVFKETLWEWRAFGIRVDPYICRNILSLPIKMVNRLKCWIVTFVEWDVI
ncbi:MAG: hypothetical protein WAK17_07290 [Candidatus Nitrosopolaris sp.]|jgi:hypothetical protein